MRFTTTFSLILFSGFAIVGWSEEAHTADPATYLADLTKEMQVEWPENRTINIVFHGHSVPAGYAETPTVDTLNAYPQLTLVGLKKRFPHAVINVIVTAIGGESAVSGAARFDQDVLTHRPDVVFIDYALNDRGLGLERAKAAWSSMIESAQKHGIKVILMTPTGDKRAKLGDPNDPLNQHAEQIRGLAKEYGVGLVDSLALVKNYVANGGPLEDLMAQVNHPNRKGHELVADAILAWFP
jgi:lysophospholipase L1-like esterase